MKKFLTVLLVIAVMFTFSFGSAFAALPSDEATAGLTSAREEAIAKINAYLDLSKYDAIGQANIKTTIKDYTDAINGKTEIAADGTLGDQTPDNFADTVAEVYLVYGKAIDALNAIEKAGVQELQDAKDAAKAQITDYIHILAGTLGLEPTDDEWKAAGLDQYVEKNMAGATTGNLEAVAHGSIDNSESVEEVDEALNKYLLQIESAVKVITRKDITQADIDALVKAIRMMGDAYKVTTDKSAGTYHSDAVAAEYEATLAAGVAAAKAVATWDEYFKIADKYLGVATSSKANAADGTPNIHINISEPGYGVYVHIQQNSVFEKLYNKNIVVEKKIDAVEAALASIGDYVYSNVTVKKWADAEDLIAEARYFVENGVFTNGGNTPTENADAFAFDDAEGNDFNGDEKTGDIMAAADTIVAAYEALTKVGAEKDTALRNIADYKGEGLKTETISTVADAYSAANANLINAYKAEAANLINAATTVDAVEKVYDDYEAKIDAVETKLETSFKGWVADFNEAVDELVANVDQTKLSTDEQAALARYVADIKALHLDTEASTEQTAATYKLNAETGTKDLQTLLTEDTTFFAFSDDNVTALGYKIDAPQQDDYELSTNMLVSTSNWQKANAAYQTWNTVKDASVSLNWANFFKAYDTAVADIDAVITEVQLDYLDAVEAAKKAIAEIPATVVLTPAFETKLTTANTKIEAVTTKYDAITDVDEQAEVYVALDTTAYDNASYEYEYMKYTDGLVTASMTTVAEVKAFTEIAGDFLGTVNSAFDAAGKLQIAQVVTNTYAAIEAAATDAAKADAALAGIEALDAIPTAVGYSAQDTANVIAVAKAEAARYFAKYEQVTFTSDATAKLALGLDIVEFQAEFIDEVAKAEWAKAYLQDLDIKARSEKTAKKNVKVTVYADVQPLLDAGFSVEYKFYRSLYSNKKFGSPKKVSAENVYTNTAGVKGKVYYYKAVIVVKNADGAVVAQSPLKHCLYAKRTWTK